MNDPEMTLEPPVAFPFPFKPYDIQDSFMRSLFQTLEKGGLGIFESPTGTGKSLSLICGALTWYLAHEKERMRLLREKMEVKFSEVESEGDDWIKTESRRIKENEEKMKAKLEFDFLKEKQERMKELRRRRKTIQRDKTQKIKNEFESLFKDRKDILKDSDINVDSNFDLMDDENIVEDYFSDDSDDEFNEQLMKDDENKDFSLRIFYCSRTHSQISQFVKEILKSPFGNDVRVTSLASRNLMCINDKVKKMSSNNLVNEMCLDLQRKSKTSCKTNPDEKKGEKKKKINGCPFYRPSQVNLLSDQSLLQVMDIEQLVAAGRQVRGCPYYASRHSIQDAQIITLPYNTLLHKPTRDAIGINLKNSVVIIDEAHNLLDTLTHIHSVDISGQNLIKSQSQLKQYLDRYKSRLKAKNLLYIKQIKFILDSFVNLLGGKMWLKESKMISPVEFLMLTGIDNLDKIKLVKYMNKSKIVHKVKGFMEKENGMEGSVEIIPKKKGLGAFLSSLENQSDGDLKAQIVDKKLSKPKLPQAMSPLSLILEFLDALTFVRDAKILINLNIEAGVKGGGIKYCLLNPSNQFHDLVKDCRSIIVAGGTMQPVSEFREQLFMAAGADPARISHFSFGHVVSKDSILPLVVSSGPSGKKLDFSYNFRNHPDTLQELFQLLSNLDKVMPHGVVCFFPSYDFELKFHEFFSKRVTEKGFKKQIYREPKQSQDMDKVLSDYSRSAKSDKGAILFSVVGGKMSEGINFSDDLGRCVVMVGLPFPNSKSVELQEKMKFLNENFAKVSGGRDLGQIHYENLCMKAVNQSIGRAIRHKGDYAAILLVDQRYQRENIMTQLPGWIQDSLMLTKNFPQVMSNSIKFFKKFK